MLPFDSMEAHLFNYDFFKTMKEESEKASKWLAEKFGEPEWCKGYGVRNTHRCVRGDTKILTDKGQFGIKDLVGKEVSVWNGEQFSKTTPFETGVSELYRVKFSNGLYLDCTADHKFLIATPKRDTKEFGGLKTIEVETRDLRVGDCLPKFMSEVTCSGVDLKYAYTAGLFCGDGSISNAKAGKYPRNELRLYGNKQALAKYVDWKSETIWGGDGCVRGYLPEDILPKYVVPLHYSKESKQKWLSGLIDSDGSANSHGISISMKNYTFAVEVSLLVQSLGGEPFVHSKIRTGGYYSDSDEYFVVTISLHSIPKVFDIFKPKRVKCNTEKTKTKVGKRHLVEVTSVEPLNVSEMTYCFTEPLKGKGVFNGILTKQCAIAPTKSTALLMGGVSEGINPDPAMTFTQASAGGEIERVNPTLLDLMKKKGVYNKKNIQQVIDARGSVQGVDWLDEKEKAVFKTAFEIDQYSVVRAAATRSEFLDQWQSWNLFFAAEEDPEYISQVHKQCWLDERIRGMYYVYSKAGVTASKDCAACQ